MIIKVPQMPWYGDTELELKFPDSWEVTMCRMPGQDTPALSEEDIQAAFLNPIGTDRIADLARGKKEVVIIFDDLSRPTRIAGLVPFVLRELAEGGIRDDKIRFIAANGAHGAMKLMDFVKKLGQEIVQRFPVYNHNPYENCAYLGTTSRGTRVSVNSEVMSCDLKIAIGAVLPHSMSGFGGGGKSILPGVAHIDTITANHGSLYQGSLIGKSGHGEMWGHVEDNAMRLDVEEAAGMAGLDLIVNAVVNMHRDTVGLFVGDHVQAHREGVKLARAVYATEIPSRADVVVANAYSKANEGLLMVQTGSRLLKEEGGDLVMICNIPEGQICHYLLRSFGKSIGGRLWKPRTELPSRVRKMIVLGTYVDKAGLDWIGPPESIIGVNSWPEVLDILSTNRIENVKVNVIPDGTIEYFPKLWETT